MSASDRASEKPTPAVARSSRDPHALGARLEAWLAQRLASAADPTVDDVTTTSATGMSSETLLVDAAWSDGERRDDHHLVVRLAPRADDVPVFPSYSLDRQFEAIRRVRELGGVPVPRVWWYEPDPAVLGTPFFVMSRVDGAVPPDVLPYNFGDNWLFDASAEQQRHLQDASVRVLAELHAVTDPESEFAFLADTARRGSPLRHKVDRTREWYEWVLRGDERSPLLDAAFAWLEAHWPANEGTTVLSWGDSRIGNVLYRDFEPVAVLDWEMACLGPRELDVAWMAYAHDVFEDIAANLGAPGMPGFLRLDDVATTYEDLTGVRLSDLGFFTMLAAIQYAIVFLRTGQRSIHFGEREPPEHLDDLLMNRAGLERLLARPA